MAETTLTLTDEQATWLADTMARRRAQFAGWTMETDPAGTPPAGTDTPPAVEPPAPADPTPADDGETDPRVKRANAEAASYRTKLRAQEQATADVQTKLDEQGQTLARLAAVFNPEAANVDPAEQVATITAEADKLRTEVSDLRAELLVFTLAADPAVNANAAKLLDSRSFTTALHGLDPSAENYREQVAEAITAAVTNDANLASSGLAPARGGVPGAGQGSAQTNGAVTAEQFAGMDYAQRSELYANNPDLYRSLAGA